LSKHTQLPAETALGSKGVSFPPLLHQIQWPRPHITELTTQNLRVQEELSCSQLKQRQQHDEEQVYLSEKCTVGLLGSEFLRVQVEEGGCSAFYQKR